MGIGNVEPMDDLQRCNELVRNRDLPVDDSPGTLLE
jgi:hypothetical protein